MSATEPDLRIGRFALTALLLGATIRLVAAVIAGLIVLVDHDEANVGRQHVGEVLNTLGVAGDGIGALLVAITAGAVWALSRHAAVSRPTVAWTRAIALVTALMTVSSAVGVLVLFDGNHVAYQLAVIIGFAVAYLVICLGSLLVLSRIGDVDVDQQDSGELEPLLFAVDRGSGEVFAFFTFAQARRTISSYSVEENEYDFFTDEGRVVHAAAHDLVTQFTPTDEYRREDLMRALRAFARAKGLVVEDPQDLTSYAVPIADWQWLELWPGWMRPLGKLVRRIQDSSA